MLVHEGLQHHSAPSVRRALPPVGVQRTAEQLEQTTTVCEWLKTVVLQHMVNASVLACHDCEVAPAVANHARLYACMSRKLTSGSSPGT